MKPQREFSCSPMYRIATAARKAGCLDRVFRLPQYTQAMIAATVETDEMVYSVIEYLNEQESNSAS